jgi:hypothetical protein
VEFAAHAPQTVNIANKIIAFVVKLTIASTVPEIVAHVL